jgi:hypothetical protein
LQAAYLRVDAVLELTLLLIQNNADTEFGEPWKKPN